MTGKTGLTKLAASLAAVALMLGSPPGNIGILFPAALAEEAPAGEEAVPAAGDETAPEASEEETAPEAAEEETAPEAEESLPQPAEEEAPPQAKEEAPEAPAAEQETASSEPEEVLPQPAEEKAVPEAAEEAAEEKHEPAPAPEAEPGDSEKEKQPEEPSGESSVIAADPVEEKAPADSGDAGSVPEETPEQPAGPDCDEPAGFAGTAEIRLVNKGMLNYGDEIVLKAVVRDVDRNCRLIWEARDDDHRGWYTVGSGEEYRFILDRESAAREYRTVILAAD